MNEAPDPDYDLRPADNESSPSNSPPSLPQPALPIGAWIITALVIIAVGTGGYVIMSRRRSPTPSAAQMSQSVTATGKLERPLGGAAELIAVPPLDQSDPVVRTLVRGLSQEPAVAAWLTTNDLIRAFTVVVVNIAEGMTPAKHLRILRPSSDFRVIEQGGEVYIDPRSYERYTVIANAVASVNPTDAARIYATLKARITEAYGELGYPDRAFDRPLQHAILVLLGTPVVDGPVRVRPKPKGVGYAYADGRLESLTDAQKQLLRMGPHNVRLIEGRLRGIALALGIQPGDLPAG